MNDITKVAPSPDSLALAAADIYAKVQATQERLAKETARADAWESHAHALTRDKESLEHAYAALKAERDHYMRHSTELAIRLNDVRAVIDRALVDAKQIAYRPPQAETVAEAQGKAAVAAELEDRTE